MKIEVPLGGIVWIGEQIALEVSQFIPAHIGLLPRLHFNAGESFMYCGTSRTNISFQTLIRIHESVRLEKQIPLSLAACCHLIETETTFL